MAYTPNDVLVRIEGTLAGVEAFANSWALIDQSGTADPQDAADAFHTFYSTLATTLWPDEVKAVSFSYSYPQSGNTGDASWADITGSAGGAILPTECALRVSLSAPNGVRGGPFLAGFRAGDLDVDGTIVAGSQDVVRDALAQLNTDLNAAEWSIGIHSPTSEAVYSATLGRVGKVFDVIRRRRNQLPESYLSTPLG